MIDGEVAAPFSVPTWVRSGRCESSGCVEVAFVGEEIAVRNSTQPDGPVVRFTKDEWRAFLGGVLDGEFQPS
jgi:Domain of unknown function (DUF397)